MVHGVIGVGAIAAAIVTGLCDGVEDAPTILLSPRNPEIAADLARRFRTVRVCQDNQAAIEVPKPSFCASGRSRRRPCWAS